MFQSFGFSLRAAYGQLCLYFRAWVSSHKTYGHPFLYFSPCGPSPCNLFSLFDLRSTFLVFQSVGLSPCNKRSPLPIFQSLGSLSMRLKVILSCVSIFLVLFPCSLWSAFPEFQCLGLFPYNLRSPLLYFSAWGLYPCNFTSPFPLLQSLGSLPMQLKVTFSCISVLGITLRTT